MVTELQPWHHVHEGPIGQRKARAKPGCVRGDHSGTWQRDVRLTGGHRCGHLPQAVI